MADPAPLDLARRAVACPRWRWMPRMVDQLGRTVLAVRDGMCLCAWWTGPAGAEQPASGWVRIEQMGAPDFDDPATVGCLEALVQRVLGHDGDKIVVHVQWGVGAGYRVMRCRRLSRVSYQGHEVGGCHDTKIAALVAALEATPR